MSAPVVLLRHLAAAAEPFCRAPAAGLGRPFGTGGLGRLFCAAAGRPADAATPLARQLAARLRAVGPMTVAEYMSEVLVHPLQGYYSARADIGAHGDFVTAPEVAGMYGEMLGVWLVNEWQKLGAPQPLQLVELGPGRGTLMSDILQVVDRLAGDVQLSVHLVEVSRPLAHVQASTLGVRMTSASDGLSDSGSGTASSRRDQSEPGGRAASSSAGHSESGGRTSQSGDQSAPPEQMTLPSGDESDAETCDVLRGTTARGRDVLWHTRLQDVPEAFSLVVANEFFDALPVHQFRRTDAGWREVLVDLAEDEPHRLRFVLARGRTPACLYIDEEAAAGRDELEVCPRAGLLTSHLAARLAQDGGAALICDYGHTGDRGDTLRAFRKHKCVEPLLAPGSADITCDVDFAALARAAGPEVLKFGPVSQRQFLAEMGLATRLERLLTSCPERADQLRAAYSMLTGDMGERFKMWALLPATAAPILRWHPPAGFAAAAASGLIQ
ncbi:protein arginine methyltransferase NDUFAF7 homolog, mitochondrial-like [Pollicipes pollicipes]|uniref:protein arginine methyltransferase NDUFAF7 homolog, mitochondrial-like n=1 Tax=Pollicipes pollicipes TaxID=41117 RepID=UPI00188501A7|nr:protein arginine methyltransferase NDUFAF7 homolog, mitochondrial-like [Pollicipes pollicipes]